MTGEGVPQSVWSGSFRIFGVEVRCHVLSDGERIIEAESMHELLAAMRSGASPQDIEGLAAFGRWRAGAG